MSTIVNTLGAGSGIDTEALVTKLVAAQRQAADKTIATRKTDNDARISAMGQVTSALSAFSTALSGLVSGGSLSASATSSDASTVAASFTAGSAPLDATLQVQSLASAQTLSSATVASAGAAIGQGTLTLQLGTLTTSNGVATGFAPGNSAAVTVTIGPETDSLNGLAAAINAAKGGVTATVVTDSSGARLVLKGATGTARGFTVTADPALSSFAFGVGASGGMTLGTAAANAHLVLDGLAVETAGNSVTDLVPGVKLELKKTGTVTLGTSRDSAALTGAVNDYVSAYNEVSGLLATLTKAPSSGTATDGGALRTEPSVRALQARLKALTSTRLLTSGSGPSSLAEIGVRTGLDGTLGLDAAKLAKAVAADPDRVQALFTAAQTTSSAKVAVTSSVGKVRSGVYSLTDVAPATAGTLAVPASGTAFASPVIINSTNQLIRMTVDGRSTLDVTIPNGTYADGASLAAAIQGAVNADVSLTSFGKGLTAAWTGSGFAFASKAVGSTSMVSLDTIDAGLATRLGLGLPAEVNGSDAAGKINGVAMTGIGDRLVSPATSAAVGLTLQILSGAPASSSVTISGGASGLLADIYTDMATGSGALAGALARLNKEKAAIAADTTALDTKSTSYKSLLSDQFAAMEKAVAAFKSTQDFLKQQIEAWNAARSSS